jgi:transcriptional regulator
MLNNPNALREFRDSRENISNIESEVSEVIETHEKTKNLDPVLKSQIKLQAV